ncbi:MAG: phage tail protein [Micavibrio aeruginosavorus]|uniref:Phage tail protein n=1 Tax=Micavibrio aeruginosavorus TaxID=349221 RepID=A0A2W5MXD9_9BACT|nr:MAG: phage tail protein [Micavibrio aeruginosavorus]
MGGCRMIEAFVQMLQSLLPQGQAWNREKGSVLTSVLGVIASEFVESYNRALALLNEIDPRSSLEMLSDWEAVAGLPDLCTGTDNTFQERRRAAHHKITNIGGQDPDYFISVANDLGYDIEITEYRPFTCGYSECGRGISSVGNKHVMTGITDDNTIRFFWKVKVIGPRVTFFQCGQSECGRDPLAKISRANDLECLFRRYKPSHTELIFAYEGI